ncbi:MAG: molybdenum cofactor guanylyltransferase [Gemmatimonadota bacterium]|nr:molybdenum cofactor guanylyltransferase [Gemmatimonadota bacterium]
MNDSGIILTGGESRRMGTPKYSLPFGDETLLQRSVRNLRGSVYPIAVVGAPGQNLPDIPHVLSICDPVANQGPLMGLMAGLKHVEGVSEWALGTGCDMPFISNELIQCLKSHRTTDSEIVIPCINGQFYPLCALYRTALWRKAELLLEKGERRLLALVDVCRVQTVEQDALARIDPDLRFLMNINTPQCYQSALELAGLRQ